MQDTITKQPGFGEQRANQWHARARPALMVVLIEAHRGKDFPHTDAIAKLLKDAIDPCDATQPARTRYLVGLPSPDCDHHRA